jgi:hypothetical protein
VAGWEVLQRRTSGSRPSRLSLIPPLLCVLFMFYGRANAGRAGVFPYQPLVTSHQPLNKVIPDNQERDVRD